MSHFGFVHEGWLGSRDATAIEAYAVETTATGVLATGCKAVQPQSNLHSTSAAEVEYTYEVTAPYAAVLTKLPESGTTRAGWRESIALFICPVTPRPAASGSGWPWQTSTRPTHSCRNSSTPSSARTSPCWSRSSPRLPLDPRAEMHSAADRMSSAYRRYLRASGITFGVC